MSIIFIGSTVDRETLKKLPDASVAGNKMELGFVKGFIGNGISTLALSVEAHGMWKFNKQPIFIKKKKLKDDLAEIETIPYINLPCIKQIMIMCNLQKRLKQLLKCQEYKDSTLVVYNTMTIFASPVLKICKKRKNQCIGIVADLPINFRKSILRKMEDRNQIKAISKFNGLIPLTKYIAQDFAKNIPYFVIEAGCNPEDYLVNATEECQNKEKKIVFSGTLNQLSGIDLLLEAMGQMNEEQISLHIYGDGPLKQSVMESASKTKNVFYHGRVSNEQMVKIQQQASLLVCPRKKDEFTTKYTFPSKVLEYVCSGVPVLMNPLQGIPEEYAQYVNYSKAECPMAWTDAICIILSNDHMAHYKEKAMRAKVAVLQKKSWSYQTKQALDYFYKTGVLDGQSGMK